MVVDNCDGKIFRVRFGGCTRAVGYYLQQFAVVKFWWNFREITSHELAPVLLNSTKYTNQLVWTAQITPTNWVSIFSRHFFWSGLKYPICMFSIKYDTNSLLIWSSRRGLLFVGGGYKNLISLIVPLPIIMLNALTLGSLGVSIPLSGVRWNTRPFLRNGVFTESSTPRVALLLLRKESISVVSTLLHLIEEILCMWGSEKR